MNITEIINSDNANIIIPISAKDLKDFALAISRETADLIMKQKLEESELEYLTQEEVANILRKSPRTIQRYEKKGIITNVGLGGRSLYKKSEIKKLLETN